MAKTNEYVYSLEDFESALQDTLKDMFGYRISEFIIEQTINRINKYVNLYRFYSRNCVGCTGDTDDCDFSMGKGEARGAWEKAVRGELYNCPVRVNGTLMFDTEHPEQGIRRVNISDQDKPPYPTLPISKEGKDEV